MKKLNDLLRIFDKEFDVKRVIDNWEFCYDEEFLKYAQKEFVNGSQTGLVIRNSDDVSVIYTAFSPSRYVLEQIRKRGVKGSLLVVKHPFDWDGSSKGLGFINFSEFDFELMKEMGINLYSLHTPMDKNRNDDVVSTAYGFARVIGLKVEREFASQNERNPSLLLGLIGSVDESSFEKLSKRLSNQLDFDVKTLKFAGDSVNKVAVVTGGGFVPRIVQEAKDLGVDTFITGVVTPNGSEFSRVNYPPAFAQIKAIGINVIGCSHYLTEKWAMEFSVSYFSKYCKAEFVEDKLAYKRLE